MSAEPFRSGLTITRAFVLWLLGVSLLTLIVVSGLVLSHEQRVLHEELVTSSRLLARVVALAVAEGEAPENLPVAEMNDVRALEVRDGTGRLMWRFGPASDEVLALDDSVIRIEETVRAARDVPVPGGAVEVALLVSAARTRRHLAQSAIRLVLGLTLALALSLVVGTGLVGRIVRPLRELAAYVRVFHPEESPRPAISRAAGAEVADLAHAFAEMGGRLAEQRRSIAASERRYRELFAASPTPLLELDPNLHIRGANPAAVPFLGADPDEPVGASVAEYLEGLGEQQLVEREDETGVIPEAVVEVRWVLPDGESSEVEVHLRPTGDGYLMAIHDLSDRIRRMGERWRRTFDAMADGVALVGVEGDIAMANRALMPHLEAVVQDLEALPTAGETSEWQTRRDERVLHCTMTSPEGLGHRILVVRDVTDAVQAEAKLREAEKIEAVGTLAGGIAHDFNNLLAAILLHVRWLEREPKALAEAAEAIRDLAEEGAEVVRELLLFARRESTPHRGMDFARLVSEQEGVLRHLIPAGVTLTLIVDQVPLPVVGNPVALRRLLLNLVLNAREAVDDDDGRIDLRLGTRDDHVVLEVVDNGVGIHQEHRQRLFEPFFSLRPEGRGAAGLGLAVVYTVVDEHGGRITVDSETGKGSRITVLLPLARDAEVESETVEEHPPGGTLAGRVLLVEDDGKLAARLVEELVAVGLDVRHAPSLEAARTLAADWAPEAVVADLLLGEEVSVGWLKELEIPVVVVTANSDLAWREGLDRSNTLEILDKPVVPERLFMALRKVLKVEG